jgi:hypothetical protein
VRLASAKLCPRYAQGLDIPSLVLQHRRHLKQVQKRGIDLRCAGRVVRNAVADRQYKRQ